MSNFRVGQKVVCFRSITEEIGDCLAEYVRRGGVFPEVGTVYTVKRMWNSPITHEAGVYLVEIRNPIMNTRIGPYEIPFHAVCFRPVAKRKTDISIFKAMLTPSKKRVSA